MVVVAFSSYSGPSPHFLHPYAASDTFYEVSYDMESLGVQVSMVTSIGSSQGLVRMVREAQGGSGKVTMG